MIEALIGLVGGAGVVLLAFIASKQFSKKIPILVGPEKTKCNTPMRTYTLIDSAGNKSILMSNKNLNELIGELDALAMDHEYNKKCTS